MKFVLEIDSENSALSGNDFPVGDELARVLHQVANQVHGQDHEGLESWFQRLRDTNGNVIGHAVILPDAVHRPTEALRLVEKIATEGKADALREVGDLAYEAGKPHLG